MKRRFFLIMLIFFFVIVWSIFLIRFMFPRALWLDEANTVLYVKESWSTMLDLVRYDFSPPLYYILLKIWMTLFGSTKEWFLRIPSLFFGVLSIFYLFLFGKRWWGKRVGLLSAFTIGISFSSVLYFFEVRMYASLIFFSILSGMSLFVLLFDSPQRKTWWWAVFILSTVFGVYTHYTFWFLVATQNLGVLLLIFLKRNSIRFSSWFLSQLILVISYIPWWEAFLKRVYFTQIDTPTYWTDLVAYEGRFFLEDILITIFLSPFERSFLPVIFVKLSLIVAMTLFIKKSILSHFSEKEILLFMLGIGPMLFLWIWGVWIVRYALVGVPFLILWVMVMFEKLSIPIFRNGMAFGLLLATFTGSLRALPEEAKKVTRQFPQIISEIQKHQNPKSKSFVIVPSVLTFRSVMYYANGTIPLKNLFPQRLVLEKGKDLQYETQYIGMQIYTEEDRVYIETEIQNFDEVWWIKKEPDNTIEDPLHIIPTTLEKHYHKKEESRFGDPSGGSGTIELLRFEKN